MSSRDGSKSFFDWVEFGCAGSRGLGGGDGLDGDDGDEPIETPALWALGVALLAVALGLTDRRWRRGGR